MNLERVSRGVAALEKSFLLKLSFCSASKTLWPDLARILAQWPPAGPDRVACRVAVAIEVEAAREGAGLWLNAR